MKQIDSGRWASAFDVALSQYGTLDGGLARLLTDNPGMVQGDGSLLPYGSTYTVGEAEDEPNADLEKRPLTGARQVEQAPVYRGLANQSLFDVALMQYGSLDGLAILIGDNPDTLDPNGNLSQFRRAYSIRTRTATDARMKKAMLVVVPCSGFAPASEFWITADGEFWMTADGIGWTTQ